MSKDVDRQQVLQNIKVRKARKKDGSWIQTPKDADVTPEVKQKPDPARRSSYVLEAIKKFESSANETNEEVDPAKDDAPPEETKDNTTRDAKLKPPSEELIKRPKTREQKPIRNTNGENKQAEAEAPAGKSNGEHNMVPANVNKEEQIRPAPEASKNVGAAEPPPAKKTAGVKGTVATNADDPVSSDPRVKAIATDTAAVPVIPAAVLQPQEYALIRAEPANTSSSEDGGEVSVPTTKGNPEKTLQQETKGEIVSAASQLTVEDLPESAAAPDEGASLQASGESDMQFESASKSPTRPANETPAEGILKKHPPEQDNKESVEDEVGAQVETPDVDNATPGEGSPPVNSVQPAIHPMPDSHAAEGVVIAVKYEVDPMATDEPLFESRTEKAAEAEIRSVASTAVGQNVEPSPEDEVRHMDLKIEDALTPMHAGDAETVRGASAYGAVDLTNATDVMKAPGEKAAPVTEESDKPHGGEPKQRPDDTEVAEGLQKPREAVNSTKAHNRSSDGKPLCSYCDKVIDGNTKITLSEPPVTCHPECLKCGVCAKALGDLQDRIFSQGDVIKCGDCFERSFHKAHGE
ncbi:zinc finger protein 185 [Fundulus heteroclitus]|uniref:zinc finger protein 185 n=1 Tax=Fundulus heteroclitus TaxID=8078 RepID=UPI00165BF57E|nr:zinc finger protein 185 [Fundulus heteroclitus]